MKLFQLERQVELGRPIDEVFAFFADPRNLDALTPPWLAFRIETPDVEMREGTRIDYSLRLHGVPISWTSEITAWDPPRGFVDEQRRGPYRRWRHEHTFEALDGQRTLARDRLEYAVPGGALVRRLLVARDLERIFNHRKQRMLDLLDH